MNLEKIYTQTSNYPEGYIKNISNTYQENYTVLEKIAKTLPVKDIEKSNVADMIEFRLLKSQEKLLELGASLQVSNIDDVTDLLEFWYQVVIETEAPDNISAADELILAIYNYLSPRTP